VIILSDEIVGHTREKIQISPDMEVVERKKPRKPPGTYKPYEPLESGLLDGMPAFGQGYKLLIDGQCHDETGNRAGNDSAVSGKLVKRLCEKITRHAAELESVEDAFLEDAEVVVVAYGSVARSALDAVKKARAQGINVGFIRMKILWPFPDRAVKEAIRNAVRIIVPEMNIGKICREVERLATNGQEVISLSKMGGVLHRPDEIIDVIKGR
jgi:2-oxoglutarate ferredoxin oxidoreductase subunit alpha